MGGKRDEELMAQGWTRQFLADEPRLSEAVDLYGSLGFEVHLEPLTPEEQDECRLCLQTAPERFKVIYTRPMRGVHLPHDDSAAEANGMKGEADTERKDQDI